jgi:ArsR family transcriptional regulator, arsenate/arsenite/antimonite-responsive transcriptional repressor
MTQFMKVAKALADENRIRILLFLESQELCLCQIIELLKLSPSTVSKHVSVLANAGLIEVRKEGKWHYYRRPGSPEPAVAAAYQFLENSGVASAQIRLDKKALKQVLKMDKEELCRHYAN